MSHLRNHTLSGCFFHAPVRGEVEILEDALIRIDGAGRIDAVIRCTDPAHAMLKAEAGRAGTLVPLGPRRYCLPGFVDLHLHAPQYAQLGTALHISLKDWLNEHTFPLEARYEDAAFAERVYRPLVDDLLAVGTTTVLFFATLHQEATRLLVDICLEKGMRALVGKVAMDLAEACPDYYRDASPEAGIAGTAALIDYVRTHPDNGAGLVLPAITPRFIPTCSDPLLEGLGRLAKDCGCHVQTHCSESDWEHETVRARMGRSDSEALDAFGLMTRKSVLAHSVFLSDSDMDLVARRGAGVAHCPLSNVYFSNAVFPLARALEKGLRVGLGTDISGGPSSSQFDTIRMAVAASRMLEEGVAPDLPPETRGRPGTRIDWKAAFHLATAGGADVLDLPVGSFAPGKAFDAMVIDTAAPSGTVRLFDDQPEEVLQKILFGASRANVAEVYVAGRQVSGAA